LKPLQAVEILQGKKKTKIEIGDMSDVAEFPKGSRKALLVGLSYKMVRLLPRSFS